MFSLELVLPAGLVIQYIMQANFVRLSERFFIPLTIHAQRFVANRKPPMPAMAGRLFIKGGQRDFYFFI